MNVQILHVCVCKKKNKKKPRGKKCRSGNLALRLRRYRKQENKHASGKQLDFNEQIYVLIQFDLQFTRKANKNRTLSTKRPNYLFFKIHFDKYPPLRGSKHPLKYKKQLVFLFTAFFFLFDH